MSKIFHHRFITYSAFFTDAAEVVLFRCIDQIKNEKGEVTAIEMSFDFLDDFQDPIEGGIYGVVNTLFANPDAEDNISDIELNPRSAEKSGPVSLVKFQKRNHILQWMVCACIICLILKYTCNF